MEWLLAPQIWIAMLGAAALTGWLLGDLHGAARGRARNATSEGELESLFVNSAARHPSNHDCSSQRYPDREADLETGAQPDFKSRVAADHGEASALERYRRPRHTIFADMPPLSELHEQARTIASADRIWATQGVLEERGGLAPNARTASSDVLACYERSIEQLQSADNQIFFGTDNGQHKSDDPYKPL